VQKTTSKTLKIMQKTTMTAHFAQKVCKIAFFTSNLFNFKAIVRYKNPNSLIRLSLKSPIKQKGV
jgi:hypothetical protein